MCEVVHLQAFLAQADRVMDASMIGPHTVVVQGT